MNNCKANALGIALAVVGSLWMLILSIVGFAGYAPEAVSIMQAHHVFFDLTVLGVIAGIVEAAIVSYIAGYVIAVVYNKYA